VGRLTHQWSSAIGVSAVNRDRASAAFEQEPDDAGHVEPGGHAEGGNVVYGVLRGVEGVERYVWVYKGDAKDVETVLGHKRRVGRVDCLPSRGEMRGGGEGGERGDAPIGCDGAGEDCAARAV